MTKVRVKIYMYDYINKLLTELPSAMNGSVKTPAMLHLFNMIKDATKLLEVKVQLFHHLVAKLLYLSYRTRQDIQTAVAFLCTRVQSPEEDDYKKLTRVMQYLWTYKDITLTLEPGEQPNWWVDSSYAVHPDMCSSGIVMSLGKGTAYSTSCTQKLNTKSSTEAELVAIDDTMGQILWTRNFLNGQGISTTSATNIYQDNKSTILLAENG